MSINAGIDIKKKCSGKCIDNPLIKATKYEVKNATNYEYCSHSKIFTWIRELSYGGEPLQIESGGSHKPFTSEYYQLEEVTTYYSSLYDNGKTTIKVPLVIGTKEYSTGSYKWYENTSNNIVWRKIDPKESSNFPVTAADTVDQKFTQKLNNLTCILHKLHKIDLKITLRVYDCSVCGKAKVKIGEDTLPGELNIYKKFEHTPQYKTGDKYHLFYGYNEVRYENSRRNNPWTNFSISYDDNVKGITVYYWDGDSDRKNPLLINIGLTSGTSQWYENVSRDERNTSWRLVSEQVIGKLSEQHHLRDRLHLLNCHFNSVVQIKFGVTGCHVPKDGGHPERVRAVYNGELGKYPEFSAYEYISNKGFEGKPFYVSDFYCDGKKQNFPPGYLSFKKVSKLTYYVGTGDPYNPFLMYLESDDHNDKKWFKRTNGDTWEESTNEKEFQGKDPSQVIQHLDKTFENIKWTLGLKDIGKAPTSGLQLDIRVTPHGNKEEEVYYDDTSPETRNIPIKVTKGTDDLQKGFFKNSHKPHTYKDTFVVKHFLKDGDKIGAGIQRDVGDFFVYFWQGAPSEPILLGIKKQNEDHKYYGKNGTKRGLSWLTGQVDRMDKQQALDSQNCYINNAIPVELTNPTNLLQFWCQDKPGCLKGKKITVVQSNHNLELPSGANDIYTVDSYKIPPNTKVSRVTYEKKDTDITPPYDENISNLRIYKWKGSNIPLLVEFVKEGGKGSVFFENIGKSMPHTKWRRIEDSKDFYDNIGSISTFTENFTKKLNEINCYLNDAVTLDLTKTNSEAISKKSPSSGNNRYCCTYHEKQNDGKGGNISVNNGPVPFNGDSIKYYKHEVTSGIPVAGVYYQDGSDLRKRIKIPGLENPRNYSVKVYSFYCAGNDPKLIYVDSSVHNVTGWYGKGSDDIWKKALRGVDDPDNIKDCQSWTQLNDELRERGCKDYGPCTADSTQHSYKEQDAVLGTKGKNNELCVPEGDKKEPALKSAASGLDDKGPGVGGFDGKIQTNTERGLLSLSYVLAQTLGKTLLEKAGDAALNLMASSLKDTVTHNSASLQLPNVGDVQPSGNTQQRGTFLKTDTSFPTNPGSSYSGGTGPGSQQPGEAPSPQLDPTASRGPTPGPQGPGNREPNGEVFGPGEPGTDPVVGSVTEDAQARVSSATPSTVDCSESAGGLDPDAPVPEDEPPKEAQTTEVDGGHTPSTPTTVTQTEASSEAKYSTLQSPTATSPTDDQTAATTSPTDDQTAATTSPTDDQTAATTSPTDDQTAATTSPTDDQTAATTTTEEPHTSTQTPPIQQPQPALPKTEAEVKPVPTTITTTQVPPPDDKSSTSTTNILVSTGSTITTEASAPGDAQAFAEIPIATGLGIWSISGISSGTLTGAGGFTGFGWDLKYIEALNIDLKMYKNLSRYLSNLATQNILKNCTSHLSFSSKASNKGSEFFITSAIAYTNGLPHIGHAYEAICCDVLARFHRLTGKRVIFSTGTDEHGQKVDQKAQSQGKAPIEVCDFYSNAFVELYKKLQIMYDDFVRTTEERHHTIARSLWSTVAEIGDIYSGTYKGWYSVREERFIPGAEAKLTNFCDPCTGVQYQQVEEPSYFFVMEKYRKRLVEHIETHPDFIMPERTRNEILSRLQNKLDDLSISRTTFSWGIPVPGDDKHVMYVWFDALSNYVTASKTASIWPPDVQVIGKDIAWFHCVIWPCMLMALGKELPRTIFSHGFIQSSDGRKMSKSLGNVMDMDFLLGTFGVESLRYYLIRSSIFGADVSFDLDSLVDLYNADLADVIGNLVHRVTSLCTKYCDGKIPEPVQVRIKKPIDTMQILENCISSMENQNLQGFIVHVIGGFKECNAYLTQMAPWSCNDPIYRSAYIRILLESIYFLAHLLQPVLPNASLSIFEKFGSKQKCLSELVHTFDNLQQGVNVTVGEVLFKKLEKAKQE
ncbi:methionyl-tRNA synthetase, putative [Theileria equi strain WA]|uniref:methionine--tRNA ligase n=1 Tax=Theileria equi strain WA TaxID=1537102 RepID=L1LAJ0_THEEQ|nr:methionyl-tRNA synthetase, putative [Theileria equi strain WA]EKX72331.1 methionyl-tRNA synthetase, putative [Theileria equi strain WA]|eukprot:XP_004831783.1 methionyl-tRNA synthetase, putative [Theileria equi strain WA]